MFITSLHRVPYADPMEYVELRSRYRALDMRNRPQRTVLIEAIMDAFINYDISPSPDWF